MNWWITIWLVYTIWLSAFALVVYANDRDEQKVSEHYRRKWREAVERGRR
jgi:hypothetical protein